MSLHFSANQYEQPYTAKHLCNWELPRLHPLRPRKSRKGALQFIANDRGYLLDCSKKVNRNPWSNFRSTYELPRRITQEFVHDYNECLIGRYKWPNYPQKKFKCPDGRIVPQKIKKPVCPPKCVNAQYLLSFDKMRNYQLHPCEKTECNNKRNVLEYTPGDFTPPCRDILLEAKNKPKLDENDSSPNLALNQLHFKESNEELPSVEIDAMPLTNHCENVGYNSITVKPNERCPSPVIPAYANFDLARRMHQTNLDHQPLPDCVADAAFRRLQLTGENPGLALDYDPIATGVGIKTCNAGPTHCTKMKVFRPCTSSIVPRNLHPKLDNISRNCSAHKQQAKKINAMDLAIYWDYRPNEEPKRALHIDGSNEVAGPAVFACVKPSPRNEAAPSPAGHSAGIFSNTEEKSTFFDKDLMKRKLDFGGKRISPNAECSNNELNLCRPIPVPRKTPSCLQHSHEQPMKHFGKQYHSTPNIFHDDEYTNLRRKYLNDDCDILPRTATSTANVRPICERYNFLRKARPRFCHRIAPEPESHCCNANKSMCPSLPCKSSAIRDGCAFGTPHYNAHSHKMNGTDDVCLLNGHQHHHNSFRSNHCNHNHHKVLVVPQPRLPYTKKNYNISTLVPPFTSYKGGAKQGGYPEHSRLVSIYQKSYTPLENRKQSLMHTIFK